MASLGRVPHCKRCLTVSCFRCLFLGSPLSWSSSSSLLESEPLNASPPILDTSVTWPGSSSPPSVTKPVLSAPSSAGLLDSPPATGSLFSRFKIRASYSDFLHKYVFFVFLSQPASLVRAKFPIASDVWLLRACRGGVLSATCSGFNSKLGCFLAEFNFGEVNFPKPRFHLM